MAQRHNRRRLEWINPGQRKMLRRLMWWLAAIFFGLILSLQTGWLGAIEDKRFALALIGAVVAAVWFLPHIAIALIAWRYDDEIDFGPLGKHRGRGKQATLMLIFTVEVVLLPLALVLGWGRWL